MLGDADDIMATGATCRNAGMERPFYGLA